MDQTYTLSGDWADAAYFGAGDDADARLYYYAPAHRHLATLNRKVWDGVSRGVGVGAGAARESRALPEAMAIPEYVGCAACPTLDGVREMVREQVALCRHATGGRPGLHRLRVRHNALTLYTWLMLHWLTGVRPVDESIQLAHYDAATGVLAVSDKDSDAYYASRVVWIPPIARQQIAAYLKSVDALSTRGGQTYPAELFFVDEQAGEAIALTVDAVRQRLVDYPYRLNAQRHFLRTNLRECGAPGQCVDALLGHGAAGQEPYAEHSAYSVRQLIHELEKPLTTLARRCGWVVIPRS
ncbi:MAG TPA: hypothetical protein VFQ88_00105 [Nevskiaceae bacterium]|nr:hypothetical protein [Nevskiaceae bacterium]